MDIDPRLPSLRFGGGTVSLGLGVRVTVGVLGMVAVTMDAGGAEAVVAFSDRLRIEAAR